MSKPRTVAGVPKRASSEKGADRAPASQAKAPARATRGQRTKENTRNKLIEAAVRVMAAKGVEGTAIGDITEAADVGVGSFYNHFKSKQDIAEVVFRLHAAELKAVNDMIFAREEDPAVAISCIQKVFLTKATTDPVWGWFVVHATAGLPQMYEVFAVSASEHVRAGIERGRFATDAVDAAIRIILVSLVAGMRDLLEGTISAGQSNQIIQCLLVVLGVPMDEAKSISRRRLPAYVQRLYQERIPAWSAFPAKGPSDAPD